MTTPILTLSQLGKSYKNHVALKNFDLTVNQGDIIGIAGENGAGKTTLLKIISGLIPKYDGHFSLFGATTEKQLSDSRKKVGTIIESPSFFKNLTAAKNLEYYRIQRGVSEKHRVSEVLDIVGLNTNTKKKFKDFSMGQKQRLALALAILHHPQLLLLDEPINGLDPAAILHTRELLTHLAQEEKVTILISSHILSELEHLATRFVIMKQGEKIEELTHDSLQNRIQNYYEIQTTTPERTATVIEETFHTQNYEIMSDGTLHLFDLDLDMSQINAALVQHGIAVTHLGINHNNLEKVYMTLLGEKEDTTHA